MLSLSLLPGLASSCTTLFLFPNMTGPKGKCKAEGYSSTGLNAVYTHHHQCTHGLQAYNSRIAPAVPPYRYQLDFSLLGSMGVEVCVCVCTLVLWTLDSFHANLVCVCVTSHWYFPSRESQDVGSRVKCKEASAPKLLAGVAVKVGLILRSQQAVWGPDGVSVDERCKRHSLKPFGCSKSRNIIGGQARFPWKNTKFSKILKNSQKFSKTFLRIFLKSVLAAVRRLFLKKILKKKFSKILKNSQKFSKVIFKPQPPQNSQKFSKILKNSQKIILRKFLKSVLGCRKNTFLKKILKNILKNSQKFSKILKTSCLRKNTPKKKKVHASLQIGPKSSSPLFSITHTCRAQPS